MESWVNWVLRLIYSFVSNKFPSLVTEPHLLLKSCLSCLAVAKNRTATAVLYVQSPDKSRGSYLYVIWNDCPRWSAVRHSRCPNRCLEIFLAINLVIASNFYNLKMTFPLNEFICKPLQLVPPLLAPNCLCLQWKLIKTQWKTTDTCNLVLPDMKLYFWRVLVNHDSSLCRLHRNHGHRRQSYRHVLTYKLDEMLVNACKS